jgi:hypothetical protein
MKQFNHLFFTLLIFAGILSSCKKDAAVKAPRIAIGSDTTALVMAVSSTGTIIYSGTVAPSASIGVIGDFYINLSTSRLFGPKTASGWGNAIPLGTHIWSGTTVPTSAIGLNGDFYLDKATFMLYGPRTGSGWGIPLNLQGPAGNANVKTDVFTLTTSDWLWNSAYVYETGPGSYTEYFTRYYTRLNNTVTQDVLDNGMVLVYFTPSPVNNPNQWAPLAYQFDSSFGYTYNYVYVTSPGQVVLHFFFIQTDPASSLPTLSTYTMETRKYKIITVTGQTGVFMLSHHVNLNNYEEVSRVTGLWQQDKEQK